MGNVEDFEINAHWKGTQFKNSSYGFLFALYLYVPIYIRQCVGRYLRLFVHVEFEVTKLRAVLCLDSDEEI